MGPTYDPLIRYSMVHPVSYRAGFGEFDATTSNRGEGTRTGGSSERGESILSISASDALNRGRLPSHVLRESAT